MDFSDIQETPQQTQERLLKHKFLDLENKNLVESYREEWKQRTFMTKQFKPYWASSNKKKIENDDIQFIDD